MSQEKRIIEGEDFIEEMDRATMEKNIQNIFGKSINYKDKTFEWESTTFAKINRYIEQYGTTGGAVVEYKNGKYITEYFDGLGGGGQPFIHQEISKVLKYDDKIELYVKTAFVNPNMKVDENMVSKLYYEVYKDYDFLKEQFNQKLLEITEEEYYEFEPLIEDNYLLLQPTTMSDKLDTYVYVLELDSTDGQYYLSEFNKI